MYKKTQIGWFLIVLFLIILGFCVSMLFLIPAKINIANYSLFIALFIFILALMMFFKLTVKVGDDFIHLVFGIGIIHIKIKLESIKSCKTTRAPWYYSLGIHKIPNGWIYNVSTLKGVEITLKDGKRKIIGTSESDVLNKVINEKINNL